MKPRPYQSEALAALDEFLNTRTDNPCVVLPTGAGKTPAMAWAIKHYCTLYPATRVIVLAHIAELLEQGVEKMRAIWPQAPIGIFSAGLRSRDMGYAVTYASIQSVFKRACDFDPFDLIFIDEAHRVPLKDDGQYRQFIRDARLCNPRARVVGWTATPYRLSGGSVCHKDYILNEVAYEANVRDLIEQGYLAPLRTKLGVASVDTAGIRHNSRGDFDAKAAGQAFGASATVAGIVAESVRIINREGRKAVLFFCCTIEHAEQVRSALATHGIDAPTIHANTPAAERAALTKQFVAGKLRALCNVNVLSEGFDAPHVDCVVLIRPTESAGLYYQQVGRGLRLSPGKTDCLVLDFAENVLRHGPIDLLGRQRPRMATCGACAEHFPEPIGRCPACGTVLPPPEKTDDGDGEQAKPGARKIPTDPSKRAEVPILSDGKPWTMDVRRVEVDLHAPPGKPTSMRVTYFGGLESHREWVCLNHVGFARFKAESWWRSRFGEPVPATTDEAMAFDLHLADRLRDMTESVSVRQVGRFTEIVNWRLRGAGAAAVAR